VSNKKYETAKGNFSTAAEKIAARNQEVLITLCGAVTAFSRALNFNTLLLAVSCGGRRVKQPAKATMTHAHQEANCSLLALITSYCERALN
jgi:hypothetical protein